MILTDIAKILKKNEYEEVKLFDLIEVMRDTFRTISSLAIEKRGGFTLQVPGFGSFRIHHNQPRIGFNPKTREKINIPEKDVMKYRMSSKLKAALSQKPGRKSK